MSSDSSSLTHSITLPTQLADHPVTIVITGFDETDLHRSWVRATATRSPQERNARLENMCWRIRNLARQKKQMSSDSSSLPTQLADHPVTGVAAPGISASELSAKPIFLFLLTSTGAVFLAHYNYKNDSSSTRDDIAMTISIVAIFVYCIIVIIHETFGTQMETLLITITGNIRFLSGTLAFISMFLKLIPLFGWLLLIIWVMVLVKAVIDFRRPFYDLDMLKNQINRLQQYIGQLVAPKINRLQQYIGQLVAPIWRGSSLEGNGGEV